MRNKTSMTLHDEILGECEVEIQLEGVDSFILSGSSVTLDRDLTNDELDALTVKYSDSIQEKAYEASLGI